MLARSADPVRSWLPTTHCIRLVYVLDKRYLSRIFDNVLFVSGAAIDRDCLLFFFGGLMQDVVVPLRAAPTFRPSAYGSTGSDDISYLLDGCSARQALSVRLTSARALVGKLKDGSIKKTLVAFDSMPEGMNRSFYFLNSA